MASVNERIARLEARRKPSYEVPPAMDRLCEAVEDARREINGLPPVERPYTPLTPEEEAESKEGERWFLEEYIPQARAQAGSPETLALIDEWEEHARKEQRK